MGQGQNLYVASLVFLFIYVVDLLLHAFVYQRLYFRCSMRVFDLVVVTIDVVGLIVTGVMDLHSMDLPSASVLRVLRLARLARMAKALDGVKELHMIVNG